MHNNVGGRDCAACSRAEEPKDGRFCGVSGSIPSPLNHKTRMSALFKKFSAFLAPAHQLEISS